MGNKATGKTKKKAHKGRSDRSLKLATREIEPKGKLPRTETLLRDVPYKDLNPILSFQSYDQNHKTFSAASIKKMSDFCKLFERLKALSGLTWRQMEQSDNYNAHDITDWSATSERSGFGRSNSALSDFPGYQFKVFSEFRIVGFFKGPVFHVVWLDRYHKLYARK